MRTALVMNDLLVWCVGNPLLGDDAVGCRVAELTLERGTSGVIDCGTTPENHIAALRKNPPRTLLVVDAVDMGLEAGECRLLSMREMEAVAMSSHGIPLSLLLEPFAESMEIIALGVQPASLQLGAPLSAAAETAARHVADLISCHKWQSVQFYS